MTVGASGAFFSCISPKSIIYFQGDTLRYSSEAIKQTYTPTIQPGDLLSIVVGSLSPESDAIFNVPNQFTTSSMNYSSTGAGNRQQSLGYLVDSEGNIEMPLVGKIRLQDLRTQAASDTVRKRLSSYLREPTVTVRSLNFKVSILGEVARPAVYVIPDEKITLPELIGLAGDLTIYGRRDNIMLIREENGKREYVKLDLTSRAVFDSPYYYLHKNDVIYVEPVKARMNLADSRLQFMPLYVSVITTIGFVLTAILR
jgi:polysaccharide export outer membrane protein